MPTLFSLTVSNKHLKHLLRLRKLLKKAQIIFGASYPVFCGLEDYPRTMEICRLTNLKLYNVDPEYSQPGNYQAIRLNLDKLDKFLLNTGVVTLMRYREQPHMMALIQENSSTFFELETISKEEQADLNDYLLLWETKCIRGISSPDFINLANQIISLNLSPDNLLTVTMHPNDMIVDCNNDLGTKFTFQTIRPERWHEENKPVLAAIQISWPHFVKYIKDIKMSSKVQFYLTPDIPILLMEMLLSDDGKVDYGSLRVIIHQGNHPLPTIGHKVIKLPKVKKKNIENE